MSNTNWMYDPKFCDGEPCYKDCDNCPISEKILEAEQEQMEEEE